MIGKGSRSKPIRDALVQFQAVYFVAVGGAAALLSQHIMKMELVAYEDLESEAIYRLACA
jgi:fumarate hydratase subunit beta